MRGKRGRLEKLLRSKAPQLLDIDGDVCYHVHKTVKQFCKPFESFVEKWIDDIRWDIKYSTDILDSLKEICFILNVPFRKPPQIVRPPWLSVFSCLSVNMTLIDPLILLYYAWIPNGVCQTYEGDIKTIFDKYELNEQKEPLIHQLHRSLIENFYAFLGCFVKCEVIKNTPYNKLNLIDVASNVLKLKTLYVGDENEKLVLSLQKKKQNSKRHSNRFL